GEEIEDRARARQLAAAPALRQQEGQHEKAGLDSADEQVETSYIEPGNPHHSLRATARPLHGPVVHRIPGAPPRPPSGPATSPDAQPPPRPESPRSAAAAPARPARWRSPPRSDGRRVTASPCLGRAPPGRAATSSGRRGHRGGRSGAGDARPYTYRFTGVRQTRPRGILEDAPHRIGRARAPTAISPSATAMA